MRVHVHRALTARLARRAWVRSASALGVSLGCLVAYSAPALGAAPPIVSEESVSNVASSSATLQAGVNPEGADTTYRFEYGTGAAYGTSIPAPDGDAGSGTSPVAIQAHPQTLLPATQYHFRVAVTNALGTVYGSDQTFTTQATGAELALLDGRQWELVSPPNKYGAALAPMVREGGVVEAATAGDAFTYLATGPMVAEPAGNRAPELSQAFSRRQSGGWTTQDISTPNDATTRVPVGSGTEYRIFSPDLSRSLLDPLGATPLAPEVTERTQYLHDDPSGGYLPLLTAANVLSGAQYGGDGAVRFLSATPDLSHVVLQSRVPLTAEAVGAGSGLYEWAAGRLQLVSVLPGLGHEPAEGNLMLGFGYDARNAISADGSRIFWEGFDGGARHLYLRDVTRGETVQLDTAQVGASQNGSDEPQFQIASSDGSRVFFTDTERLTPDATANPAKPDLYECEIAEAADGLACDLSDLTVALNPGESAAVQGVLGAAEDGSYVYFAAGGVLAPGASPGSNLYLRHAGTTTFIAALPGDEAQWERPSYNGDLSLLPARVSPSGRFLAFMSDRSLTGYDNRDASSGEPDEEVYLYDAASQRLVCASCNPTGARPQGLFDTGESPLLLVDQPEVWRGHWLAASIPGWTRVALEGALYQSRYLSDSGRLFFDSADGLVPQDTDGVEDVYEYEPAGVGSCGDADGCVGLISSGSSAEESTFLDASETGVDVFFLTSARLVPQDYDRALDVYDAHVCSAAVPCANVTAPPPACTTADSCRPAPAPQPGVFGAPASATFAGAGNLVAPGTKPVARVAKPKAKAKKQRKRRRTVGSGQRKQQRRGKARKRPRASRRVSIGTTGVNRGRGA